MKHYILVSLVYLTLVISFFKFCFKTKEMAYSEYEYATTMLFSDIGILKTGYMGINPYILFKVSYSDAEKEEILIDAISHKVTYQHNEKQLKINLDQLWEDVSIEKKKIIDFRRCDWLDEQDSDDYINLTIRLKGYNRTKYESNLKEYYIKSHDKIQKTLNLIRDLISDYESDGYSVELISHSYRPLECDVIIKINNDIESVAVLNKELSQIWNEVDIDEVKKGNIINIYINLSDL